MQMVKTREKPRKEMEYSKWSDLPSDILALIAQRYKRDETDIGRLRAVCSSWHSSLPPPPKYSAVFPLQVPCPFLPTDFDFPRLSKGRFFLYQTTLLIVSPLDENNAEFATAPWIIEVEETRPNKWSLVNRRITRTKRAPFGKYNNTDGLPDRINLLHYKVVKTNPTYHLDYEPSIKVENPAGIIPQQGFESLNDCKVIAQSDSGVIEPGQKIVVLAMYGRTSRRMAFWRSGDEAWTSIVSSGNIIEDIICYKGDFYAVQGYKNKLKKVDLVESATVQIVAQMPLETESCDQCNLVHFDKYLFLLTTTWGYGGYPEFKSYVLNEEDETWNWKFTNDMCDGVFFMFPDTIILSVSANDLGGQYRSFVYFEGQRYSVEYSESDGDYDAYQDHTFWDYDDYQEYDAY